MVKRKGWQGGKQEKKETSKQKKREKLKEDEKTKRDEREGEKISRE